MIKHPVVPFVSKTSLCLKCFRFGHIGAQCKSHARCIDCGDNKHGDNETCSKKDCAICINCNGPHKASEYSYPKYVLQRKIREFSVYENVPLSEASACVRGRMPVSRGGVALCDLMETFRSSRILLLRTGEISSPAYSVFPSLFLRAGFFFFLSTRG